MKKNLLAFAFLATTVISSQASVQPPALNQSPPNNPKTTTLASHIDRKSWERYKSCTPEQRKALLKAFTTHINHKL